MCQILWHLDVSYTLKTVIKAIRVAQENNMVCKNPVCKMHTLKQLQTWFFLKKTSDYV